jgi:hypothetical protein
MISDLVTSYKPCNKKLKCKNEIMNEEIIADMTCI